MHEVRLIDVPDQAHHGVPLVGGADSIRRRALGELRADRLRQAGRVEAGRRLWSGFEVLFGSFKLGDGGWLDPSEVLLILGDKHARGWRKVEYDFTRALTVAHLSVVWGHHGDTSTPT